MKRRTEPTIALINVVFLMLIFFLIAGTIAPPMDSEINLVSLAELDGTEPTETLAIHPDGQLRWGGQATNVSDFVIPVPGVLRLLPDRDLPAEALIEIVGMLQAKGAAEILVVVERGLK